MATGAAGTGPGMQAPPLLPGPPATPAPSDKGVLGGVIDAPPDDESLGMLWHKLSELPVVSIAKIRGRARGAGSELALACDMRFAARENAILGQIEVWAAGPSKYNHGEVYAAVSNLSETGSRWRSRAGCCSADASRNRCSQACPSRRRHWPAPPTGSAGTRDGKWQAGRNGVRLPRNDRPAASRASSRSRSAISRR